MRICKLGIQYVKMGKRGHNSPTYNSIEMQWDVHDLFMIEFGTTAS